MERIFIFGTTIGCLIILLQTFFLVVSRTGCMKVDYLIYQNRQWNKSLLAQFIPPAITTIMINLFVPSNQIPDNLFWDLSPNVS